MGVVHQGSSVVGGRFGSMGVKGGCIGRGERRKRRDTFILFGRWVMEKRCVIVIVKESLMSGDRRTAGGWSVVSFQGGKPKFDGFVKFLGGGEINTKFEAGFRVLIVSGRGIRSEGVATARMARRGLGSTRTTLRLAYVFGTAES